MMLGIHGYSLYSHFDKKNSQTERYQFRQNKLTMPFLSLFAGRFLLIACMIVSMGQAGAQPPLSSLSIHVPFQPTPILINGKTTVYYELQLVNNSNVSLQIGSIQAITHTNRAVLFSSGGEDLNKRCGRTRSSTPSPTTLQPHDTCIVYLEFSLPEKNKPGQWSHAIHWMNDHRPSPGAGTEKGGVVQVAKQSPPVLGPPLRQGNWAAIYHPDWARGHRRVVYNVDGTNRIPGRFAIDFIRLDDQGRYATMQEDSIRNWYGYGNEVIAVADATVASVKNDFTESPTVSGHPSWSSDKATGNYISLDLGNDRFAFYEHLQPGSIKVKPGQRVKKGDVIAALGFTGQTTGPHLHFHMANANSPLGAEGIPFAFASFQLLGQYPDLENFGKRPWTPGSTILPVRNERPGPNSVIRF